MSFVTYMHTRKSDSKVFYIGKGRPRRPTSTNGRSEHWKRVAEKHGFDAQVCAAWSSEAEAFLHERLLISAMRSIGQPLVNQTDGGEGVAGTKWTSSRREQHARWVLENPEVRAATSARATAMMNDPEHRQRAAQAVAEHFALPENRAAVGARMAAYWTDPVNKKRQSEAAMRRAADPAWRAQHSKKRGGTGAILHIETGVIYGTQGEIARALGISQSAISNVLNKKKPSVRGASFKYIKAGGVA